MAEKCDQCLFTPERIVSSRRMAQVLATCARSDTHFVCHKATLAGDQDVCCRGFYDLDPGASNLMRIAGRLGAVQFVEVASVSPSKEVPRA